MTTKSSKLWMGVSLVLLVLLAGVSVYAIGKGPSDPVVATVNGVNITKSKLFDEMIASGGSQILDNMINEELVRQEADKAGVAITDADLDQELATLKKSFSSDEEFDMAMAQSGMTMDNLKRQMAMTLRMKKLLEPKTDVTDEEVQTYYEQNKESMATPEMVRASHILVATQEEADAIVAQLKSGADFAQLAAEKSTDPGSKDKGGDLDFFARGDMAPEFEEVAFTLGVGDTSGVVKSSYGYHIIKVTDKKAASTPTFDEKKEEIRQTLVEQEIQQLSSSWMDEIKGKANIQNTIS